MSVPTYRRNGDVRAFVEYQRKRYYLGRYGTKESKRRYEQWVSRLLASEAGQPPETNSSTLTILELVDIYLVFAENYHQANAKELHNIRQALRPLWKLFGGVLSDSFGPRALQQVQRHFIEADYCRGVINGHIGRIRRLFKWCARQEHLPISLYLALQTVDGLKRGRSDARESTPVAAVARDDVLCRLAVRLATGGRSGPDAVSLWHAPRRGDSHAPLRIGHQRRHLDLSTE